jgi:predicted ATPase
MLLQFTVGNFKSFKDKVTLSMEATAEDWLEETNVAQVETPELRLVKSASIYGANASGKSNLIEAMVRFRAFVLGSSKDSQKGDPIPVAPFRLSTETEAAPTFFEVVFVKNGTRYRYGFEATAETVASEWLFEQGDSIRETTQFTREGDLIQPGASFKEGKGLEDKTRSNALFLSVVAQFNGSISSEVIGWAEHFRPISALDASDYEDITRELLDNAVQGAAIRELLRQADVGVEDVRLQMPGVANGILGYVNLPASFSEEDRERYFVRYRRAFTQSPSVKVKSLHRRFGAGGELAGAVEFDFSTEESAGTRQLFSLVGAFLKCLHEGSLLVVDELDARLHPLLTRKLVELFNSSANKKGAQLIFATHDSGLLDQKSMRRDQIWFVEKNARGASELFSLAEIKGVRKDANFEREYLLGQFGGVPRVGDLQSAVAHAEE